MFEYWWNHGLISTATYKLLQTACAFNSFISPTGECINALDKAYDEQGNIDWYSLYTPKCQKFLSKVLTRRQYRAGHVRILAIIYNILKLHLLVNILQSWKSAAIFLQQK